MPKTRPILPQKFCAADVPDCYDLLRRLKDAGCEIKLACSNEYLKIRRDGRHVCLVRLHTTDPVRWCEFVRGAAERRAGILLREAP